MKQPVLLLILLTALCSNAIAQQQQSGKQLSVFFTGSWNGKGAFANGRPIEANVSFELTLDSCWMQYRHTDKKTNVYQSLSMWGTDKTSGKMIAYVFDNFQGHRIFYGDGWQENRLTLTHREDYPDGKKKYEQFVYEKLNTDQFKMTYQVSIDSLIWKEGDHLIFSRNK